MNIIKNSPVHNSDPGENYGLINLLHRVGIEEWGRLQHTVHGELLQIKDTNKMPEDVDLYWLLLNTKNRKAKGEEARVIIQDKTIQKSAAIFKSL